MCRQSQDMTTPLQDQAQCPRQRLQTDNKIPSCPTGASACAKLTTCRSAIFHPTEQAHAVPVQSGVKVAVCKSKSKESHK